VIAGGPKTNDDLSVLNFVYDGMQRGAAGVNLGRNVWQHKNPPAMAQALRAIIHEKATPKQANEFLLAAARSYGLPPADPTLVLPSHPGR